MSRIFLSYRRQDSAGYAGRLYERFSERFAPEQVFRDLDTIEAGEHWPARLAEALRGCKVVVALIGADFSSACDESGRPRLYQPDDVVRLELEGALRGGIPIIPALVRGTPMPTSKDLPASLSGLCDRQAISLGEESWDADLGRLVGAVERVLRTAAETNLPVPATPFIGRERELAEATALVRRADVRLVALTGAGGTGKTRLAVEAGSRLLADFEGVFWINLAALSDPSLVLETVAQTLGARQELAQHIGQRRVLLVLDNFEQLVAAAPAVVELLSACPHLKGLVTSRQSLHVSGEHEYEVPPLVEEEALALFRERARAVRPGFSANGTVSEICRRLDCLPLALELAAARVKVLSPAAILERLEVRLPLLTGGPRDAPERQRTLRATIAWSFDLLSEEEQRLLARLSVFAGGCTLEAAEAVCGADLDTLQSLVDKSLLRRSDDRFRMLATIREYADERLDASPETEELRRRHAMYFLALAEQADTDRLGNREHDWIASIEADHDNFRAVLAWAQSSDEAGVALPLATWLALYWWALGYVSEGLRWLDGALARGTDESPELRARGLSRAAWLAYAGGLYSAAEAFARESLTLSEAAGDTEGVSQALHMLAGLATEQEDYGQARSLASRALALDRQRGDKHAIAARLENLGNISLNQGDYEAATALFQESLALCREIGLRRVEASSLGNLANLALHLGRSGEATSLLGEGLRLAQEIGSVGEVLQMLEAAAAVALKRPARAARLLGAAAGLRETAGVSLQHFEREMHARTVDAVREKLGDDRFDALWAEGRAMTLDAAVEHALEALG